MSSFLLGIDSGLTVTKAVVFDEEGKELGIGTGRTFRRSPSPRWVERDMSELWERCGQIVQEALDAAKVSGSDIAAIGVAGHGDGVYLVVEDYSPVRPAILSLDSRALDILDVWEECGVLEEALKITGRRLTTGSPAPLLAWLWQNEPETFEQTRWVLSCKDWIKLKLTGEVATDPTEGSSYVGDVRTGDYSADAIRLFDLQGLSEKLPPVISSTDIMGEVTHEAATVTGLAPGTPVVSGLIDALASAIGSGCTRPGQLFMVAGTWSNNGIVTDQPAFDARWVCRHGVEPGRWMVMSNSPASAANMEWFVRKLCPLEVIQAEDRGVSTFDFVNGEVETVLDEDSQIFFHPFLYGSPYGDEASAGFLGLRGWHSRGHLLKALMEGVVFNHKGHVESLRSDLNVDEALLTGGAAQSKLWSQMFADTLRLAITVGGIKEAGAWGAAVCAAQGIGIHESMAEGSEQALRGARTHEPNLKRHTQLTKAYHTYSDLLSTLNPIWSKIGRASQ